MRVLGAPLRKVGDRVRAVGGEAVARREQPLDAHRPARVDPARRDPDLGAEPEAEAVGEAAWERGRRRASEELRLRIATSAEELRGGRAGGALEQL